MREQYLDFYTNRMFRQTLLVRATAPVWREVHDYHVERFAISSPAHWTGEHFEAPGGGSMTTSEPALVAAMNELGERWPESISFDPLLTAVADRMDFDTLAPEAGRQLRGVLLEVYLAGYREMLARELDADPEAVEGALSVLAQHGLLAT